MQKILITGGAGFIGSHFTRHMLHNYPDYRITVLDKLTYAGNLDNLHDVWSHPNFTFIKGDICDVEIVRNLAQNMDAIVNFAAETHVDRSIVAADAFVQTDMVGTFTLLEAARKYNLERYLQISTDEVYGSTDDASFRETDPLNPSSPYSASKSGGDLLTRSYYLTHNMPILITRCSNNYGPYQYPEKLIPLFITNALKDNQLPLYGKGENVRDWIYVTDHCRAIDTVLHHGTIGEIYNIGGGEERSNRFITDQILALLNKPHSLIKYVKDRQGHDWRYSVDSTKIERLGWRPQVDLKTGLQETVAWYRDNEPWWQKIKANKAEFQAFHDSYYQTLEISDE